MLQLKGIRKKYKTGNFVQTALDDVALDFRDNEFVAILGPSGSGKTTLLNIIGGLDRYDSGDLIINGTSTKNYKSRNWDSYRNHTIGFVFQSYNLITHQTVLANVELALTISGISKKERKNRALEALEMVGLKDHAKKKPNQLSGGQMQRVAIARALVNNPDILLADEPTGALDSHTSVQVMEILKEVAKDRLVIMVTHNPDLAQQYATRIVKLSDGKIVSDSDAPKKIVNNEINKNKMGKASMNFFTALGLSLNNLLTKKARTILVSFAGSIGIIGIALILSLSNGVNKYIKSIEEDTLSEYPVQILKTDIDFDAMFQSSMKDDKQKRKKGNQVKERKTVTNTLSNTKTNDLASLKKFLDKNPKKIEKYIKSLEYKYNINPNIYVQNKFGTNQVNPDNSFAGAGYTNMNTAGSMGFTTDNYFKLPDEPDLYTNNYKIKAGRWPEKKDELVLVLGTDSIVSDRVLYSLGMKDPKELNKAIKAYSNGEKIKIGSKISYHSYNDFIGLKYKVVNGFDLYQYDKKYKVWASKKDDEKYIEKILAKSMELKIVGVVAPEDSNKAQMLKPGVGYTTGLVDYLMEQAKDAPIVKEQLSNKKINVFTGKKFSEKGTKVNFKNMFAMDPSTLQKAFKIDESAFKMDASDMGGMDLSQIKNVMGDSSSDAAAKQMQTMFKDLFGGYAKYAAKNGGGNSYMDGYTKYLKSDSAKKTINKFFSDSMAQAMTFDSKNAETVFAKLTAGVQKYMKDNNLTDISKMSEYTKQYLETDEGKKMMSESMASMISFDGSKFDMASLMSQLSNGYAKQSKKGGSNDMADSFSNYMKTKSAKKIINKAMSNTMNVEKLQNAIAESIKSSMTAMSEQFGAKLKDAFKIDKKQLAKAMKSAFDQKGIEDLMKSLMNVQQATYDNNLATLGYADPSEPFEIDLFPKNFESKDKIKKVIDNYNADKIEKKKKKQVIGYTDIVGALMSSVTDIINAITYVLVAFVAISLIVSSIMIGVITYISVLERKKEIGVLRAMGASKRNVSNVFNAETFIIGALAGTLGVVITNILIIPINIVVGSLAKGTDIKAFLPWNSALILIALSVILTLIGGLIPSRKAAKQDPVIALRSE